MRFNLEDTLADEFNLEVGQVKKVVKLFDQGNTIPFIARYRKELTGNLDEKVLRELKSRLDYLKRLEKRKENVIEAIAKKDKLTAELEVEINQANQLQEVEDIYRPYKPKRITRASKAKEKGLEPLAKIFLKQDAKLRSLKEVSKKYLDYEKGLDSIDDVLQGTRDIIAEYVADQVSSRRLAREITLKEGRLISRNKAEVKETEFETYYDYQESIRTIPSYRVLAINRGEKEGVLQVKITSEDERIITKLKNNFIKNSSIFKEELELGIEDSYFRLIAPAIEREVRSYLTDKAEEHAINIFSKNLRNLLLQPPLGKEMVLAIDPAYRTGCKVVMIDKSGGVLEFKTVYPHSPQNKREEAKESLKELVKKYDLSIVAIGNGTACRETEAVVVELIEEIDRNLKYIIVNEAGASVYSASSLARDEFPDLDVSIRGAVSIGRRLQDPLAELVKINPKHIGVGMYQHDINQSRLEKVLNGVIESVVNYVGVDLDTASSSLLRHIAGINSSVAENIIKYREENNGFNTREELKEVYRLGPKTYTQAAGFLKITEGGNPLDGTAIHPESYHIAEQLLGRIGFKIDDLRKEMNLKELEQALRDYDLSKFVEELEVGLPTLNDIKNSLLKPGRDPREELPKPIFKKDILKLEDLKLDMILQGTVRNVVDFGAFVDIGVKEDGLVHISELSAQYVTDPLEVVTIGDTVQVKIIEIDSSRGRISLTMDF
ncbi:RNA-binding transcriptional accessory protein [Natroniella acetigena]|uniref:Tex family protein n=1 Tax=Natroniella acetigena TaxID=52004 RepID=UPI00200A487C|nr:Tex family protein [Natroniella acetigena]MCK8827509.1 RNA-binding transcriptional accessory protein [Natroniella acetigena]